MEIIAIRHTSVDVPKGICYGQTDVAVNRTTFEDEANHSLAALRAYDSHYDAVFTSPLTRCRMLADACGYTDAIPDDRLKEMNFGQWEMQPYDAIADPRIHEWYEDWVNVRPTGGESFADQYDRVCLWVDECRKNGYRRILLFAHGGIIMQLMRLSGLEISQVFKNQPKYGELRKLILK